MQPTLKNVRKAHSEIASPNLEAQVSKTLSKFVPLLKKNSIYSSLMVCVKGIKRDWMYVSFKSTYDSLPILVVDVEF